MKPRKMNDKQKDELFLKICQEKSPRDLVLFAGAVRMTTWSIACTRKTMKVRNIGKRDD